MRYSAMQSRKRTRPRKSKTLHATQPGLVERALAAFIAAGTIELSLDKLSSSVGISKRMLIHYFGDRETLEERAMALLEERLRAQFVPSAFPSGTTARAVAAALWAQTTAPQSRNVLHLIMDLSRRAWNGSKRAKAFYAEQQRLWVQMLTPVFPSAQTVEEFLQLFQGAVLAYLVTGDPEPGRRSIERFVASSRT
jgi:AcrR family transcriptional regulator